MKLIIPKLNPKLLAFFFLHLVFFIQLGFTLHGNTQLRYEEMAEPIRNLFWFQENLQYDTTIKHIGYYTLLDLWHHFFAFSLFSAKYFRLFLDYLSLICLIFLSYKYTRSFIPFLTAALSPSLIYFTSLNTHYGIDLQFTIISLTLLLLQPKSKAIKHFLVSLAYFVFFLSCLTYITSIYYLPLLLVIHLSTKPKPIHFLFSIISALGLTIGLFIFTHHFPDLVDFIADASQGGSQIITSLSQITSALFTLLNDLFFTGTSYNFDLIHPDFNLFFPLLSIFGVVSIIKFNLKTNRLPFIHLLLLSSTAIFNFISINILNNPTINPGIRRNTPILFTFYLFFFIAWKFFHQQSNKNIPHHSYLKLSLYLILIHHLLVLIPNYYHQQEPPKYYHRMFIGVTKPLFDYQSYLQTLINQDLYLKCELSDPSNGLLCRYQETYATLQLACKYNHLSCHQIYGFDHRLNQYFLLTPDRWHNGAWTSTLP